MKKRMICFMLISMLFITNPGITANAFEFDDYYNNKYATITSDDQIHVYNNNGISTDTSATITTGGKITIIVKYTGNTSTTKGVITTYIEKKILGLFWTKVNIGQTNNQWVDTIYNYHYNGSHSFQLSNTGTYRVKVNYKIYGNGAPDSIDWQKTLTY